VLSGTIGWTTDFVDKPGTQQRSSPRSVPRRAETVAPGAPFPRLARSRRRGRGRSDRAARGPLVFPRRSGAAGPAVARGPGRSFALRELDRRRTSATTSARRMLADIHLAGPLPAATKTNPGGRLRSRARREERKAAETALNREAVTTATRRGRKVSGLAGGRSACRTNADGRRARRIVNAVLALEQRQREEEHVSAPGSSRPGVRFDHRVFAGRGGRPKPASRRRLTQESIDSNVVKTSGPARCGGWEKVAEGPGADRSVGTRTLPPAR